MGSSGVSSLLVLFTILFVSSCTFVYAASEQQRLIDLVNEYRNQNGLPSVPTSYWLTATAMMHTIDRRDNGYPDAYGCTSGHSWSGSSLLFTGPCCYSGANWQCMGKKPGEISNNAFTGIGYEDWVQAGTVEDALTAWKNSPAHNDLILNLNGWTGSTWKAIGAGVCGGFYGLWVSETADLEVNGNIDVLTCGLNTRGPVPNPNNTVPSPSPSAAPSHTRSPTPSATKSSTPSTTPSHTRSPTPSATRSSTPSHTRSSTPSKSRTPTASASASASPQPTINYPKFWVGGTSFTEANTWTTITMSQTFVEPVVVCSAYYEKPQNPLVVRMRNAAGSSFDISIFGTMNGGVDVDCVAVEAGTYTVEANGINLEAKRTLSSITNSKNSWSTGTSISFANRYTNPVILGQVMTANDQNWSVFYARGASSPTSYINSGDTSCVIGKQVGEDPNTVRQSEYLGYFVMEAGTGVWGNRNYQAIKGAGSVYGVDNSPPYSYDVNGITARTGINTVNSVVGPDGGFSIFYGNRQTALANQKVALAIDEDAIADPERNHRTAESIGVLLFS